MDRRSTVLLTGASSELGRRLVQRIDRAKFRVVGMTRDRSRLSDTSIEVVEGDLRDAPFVEAAVRGVDLIIHAAAVTHSADAEEYFEVNLQGTVHLVDAARGIPGLGFVFISSRTAGPDSGAYGESKLRAEEYIEQRLESWKIIRPAEIYGSSKREGIDKLIDDVSGKTVVACPVGLASKLYPIHIEDAVRICHDLIFGDRPFRETYVVNGSEGFTYYELARLLRDRAKRRIWLVPIPRFAMLTLQWLVERGLRVGIVPDQVPRLYCAKPVQDLGYPLSRLADHLDEGTDGRRG